MPDTANPLAPKSPTNYQPGVNSTATRLRSYYTAAAQKAGVDHLAWDDPTTLMLYQSIAGLTPDQAKWASKQAADFSQQNGQAMGDYDLDQTLTHARTQVPSATDARPNLGSAIRDAYGTLVSQFGTTLHPDDPRVIQAFKDAGAGVGVTLTDDQARQIGQRGWDYYGATGQPIADQAIDQYAGTVTNFSVPDPNKVNPMVWDSLGPVGQGLALGAAQAKGWDTSEYQRQINATRPIGNAPRSGVVDYGSLGTGIMG